MTKRAYSIIISTILMLLLTVPLIIFLVTPDLKISVAEKRKLSTAPDFSWSIESLRVFPKKFDVYFQDHFGLRDTLIDLYDSIVLNYFHVSPSPYILKGEDNWYFYIAGNIGQDFYGLSLPDKQRQEIYSQILIDRQIWLNSLGIHYLFVPVPNKINVYPEKLPLRIKRLSGKTYYQQLLTYRKEDFVQSSILDTKTILTKAKTSRQVYYRTDTHWTNDGSLAVFNEMINKLQTWYPELKKIREEDIIRSRRNFNGDLKNVLHKISAVNENEVKITLKPSCVRKRNRPISASSAVLIRGVKNKKSIPFQNGCADKELTVLLLHDSFGEHFNQYLNDRFKTVIYVRNQNFHELQRFIEIVKPDIVIEQRVARNLKQLLIQDDELEQNVVEHQMNQVLHSVLNNYPRMSASFYSNTYNVKMVDTEEGIVVTALNTDPQIMFSIDALRMGKRYNAMLEISAPENTQIQFFYTQAGEIQFSDKQSIRRNIKKGYNKLYFHIPGGSLNGKIRLDPGSKAGEYIIHSFVIKEQPERMKTAI